MIELGGTTLSDVRAVRWSPNGRFLAVKEFSGGTSKIYHFNPNSDTPLELFVSWDSGTIAGVETLMDWSPNGNYIAVVKSTGDLFNVYAFNELAASSSDRVVLLPGTGTAGDRMFGVAWSPDGRYIASVRESDGSPNVDELDLYRFDPSNETSVLTNLTGFDIGTSGGIAQVRWCSDGKNIFASTLAAGNKIEIYDVDLDTPDVTSVGSISRFPNTLISCDGSPNSLYITFVSTGGLFNIYEPTRRTISKAATFNNFNLKLASDLLLEDINLSLGS